MSHAPDAQAIIGAGAAGLVSARELLREGHQVKVLERGSDLGGIWVYSDDFEEDLLGVDPNRRHVHSSLCVCDRTCKAITVVFSQVLMCSTP